MREKLPDAKTPKDHELDYIVHDPAASSSSGPTVPQLPLLDVDGYRVLDVLQESGEADATLDYGEDGRPIPLPTGAGEGGEETSGDARREITVNDTVEYPSNYEEYRNINDIFYDCLRFLSVVRGVSQHAKANGKPHWSNSNRFRRQ